MNTCPFCEKKVKGLLFHVAGNECKGESRKELSSEKATEIAKKAMEEEDEKDKKHQKDKHKELSKLSSVCSELLKNIESSINSDYSQSIFYACGATYRGGSIQHIVQTKASGSGGWVQEWIINDCKEGGFELKTKDAEMKVISELENKYKKPDDMFVILSGDGPCKSCKANITKLAKYYKITIVVGYLVAPYETTFDKKKMWYGWTGDIKVDGWYIHVLNQD